MRTSDPPRGPPVQHAVLIRAGSGKIWTALTTKTGLESWFCHAAEIRLRRGGSFRLRWKDWGPDKYTGESLGSIERVENRKRFTFSWVSHPDHPRTTVDIRLEPRGPLTVLRLSESGFESAMQAAMANAAGWGEAMTLLKFYVEHAVTY